MSRREARFEGNRAAKLRLTISAVAGTGAAELLPPPIKVNKGFKLPAAV
jgi:hypothetical protein